MNTAQPILAITSEDRLFFLLLSASIDLGWKIVWARSIERACDLYSMRQTPLVVYDQRLPGIDWREGLARIAGFPGNPVVLLAASEVNEEVWETVLRCRGYDAVRRSAGSVEWRRELLFARLSRGSHADQGVELRIAAAAHGDL